MPSGHINDAHAIPGVTELFESWLLLPVAELAEQATTQLAMAVSAVQHEAHMLLEEITVGPGGWLDGDGTINGGCSES
jgi:hypothetical protein